MSDEVLAQLRAQNRLLKLCLAATAVVAGAVALTGASDRKGNAEFTEITVERINVVNADGSRALVLANGERLPAPVINGHEVESDRGRKPGMLFYNDEGDEVGGLIYAGKSGEDGHGSGGVHLSMDRYGGDQQLALYHHEHGGHMETGLSIYDRGLEKEYGPLYEALSRLPPGPEREALAAKWREAGGQQTQRLFVGRTPGDFSALVLADKQGRPRIMMLVSPDGAPSLQFLGEDGEVLQSLPAAQGEGARS